MSIERDYDLIIFDFTLDSLVRHVVARLRSPQVELLTTTGAIPHSTPLLLTLPANTFALSRLPLVDICSLFRNRGFS